MTKRTDRRTALLLFSTLVSATACRAAAFSADGGDHTPHEEHHDSGEHDEGRLAPDHSAEEEAEAPAPDLPRIDFPTASVVLEVADTDATRAKGLGGHAPLGEYEGMLFVFERPGPHAFWMKGMTFALDMLWLIDGRVVHIERDVPPPAPGQTDASLPIYASPTAALYVLEVNAGFSDLHGIEVGTPFELHGVSAARPRHAN